MQNDLGVSMELRECAVESECGACYEGKMTRTSFPKTSESRSSAVGDLIHSPIFVDRWKKRRQVIVEYVNMMHTQFGKPPKIIRVDGGDE